MKFLMIPVTLLMMSLNLYAANSVIADKVTESVLLDIAVAGDNKLVAVGERGHILISDNEGDDWRQVIVPTDAMLTSVYFVDSQIGFAVGHQQAILKTTDGGENWQLIYEMKDALDYPALLDVWFKDSNNGVAVGAYGLYLVTSNGGVTWEQLPLLELEDPDFGLPHWYALAFDSKSSRLYMSGELGFLVVSEDFGKTWEKIESPYSGSFFNVSVTPSGSLLVMGLRGNFFFSADGGDTWSKVESSSTASINNAVMIGGTQMVYLAMDGVILLSNDDGKTISLKQRKNRTSLMSAVTAGVNRIVAVGDKGVELLNFSGESL
ncbi:MAG: YCF48-related protein [Kangiellaceae bacterium]|jgi:photosystem II stability/assembly factor-like uncharacterized protein|nr:YCF48-related protein [Kangiellaceae bacterium]